MKIATTCWEGLRRLQQELPAAASARLCLGLCCRNLACGNRLTTRSGVGAKGQTSPKSAENRLWLGGIWQPWITFAFQTVWPWDPKCLVACGRFFVCDLSFLKKEASSAAGILLKPEFCVCVSHQEDLQLETHAPACSSSLSLLSICVRVPSWCYISRTSVP